MLGEAHGKGRYREGAMSSTEADQAHPTDSSLTIRSTSISDGASMWTLARDCGLDLNSSYAYLIYAADFSATCRVALLGDEPVGYVLGYRPPERPSHLFGWQVGVSSRARGHGVAARMIHDLLDSLDEVEVLEATVEESNDASRALFASIAAARGGELAWTDGVLSTDFPDEHPGEPRLEITGMRAH